MFLGHPFLGKRIERWGVPIDAGGVLFHSELPGDGVQAVCLEAMTPDQNTFLVQRWGESVSYHLEMQLGHNCLILSWG